MSAAMTEEVWKDFSLSLKYNKGENRFKHVGNEQFPQMVEINAGWIGKCPKGFDLTVAETLVREGVPEYRLTAAERPYRIWNYHDGAIYASRSEDGGTTWHGYPNGAPASSPPIKILRELKTRAAACGEADLLKDWLKKRWDK
jgi:hypothetical protein